MTQQQPERTITTIESPQWLSSVTRTWMSESRKKILIVDDDAALLNFVRILLASSYEVETAMDGASALSSADSFQPDVIVLDLRLPEMDGRAIYRELRSMGVQSRVIILSAYGAEEARQELGADAYVAKPFDPDRLLSAVRRVLEDGSNGASPSAGLAR